MKQTYDNINKYKLICLHIQQEIEKNKIIKFKNNYTVSEFAEQYLGVKLSSYQKVLLDNVDKIINSLNLIRSNKIKPNLKPIYKMYYQGNMFNEIIIDEFEF